MEAERRLEQVVSICDSASSLVGRHEAIVSPKDGDHYVIIVGEGIFKSRLGKFFCSDLRIFAEFYIQGFTYTIQYILRSSG